MKLFISYYLYFLVFTPGCFKLLMVDGAVQCCINHYVNCPKCSSNEVMYCKDETKGNECCSSGTCACINHDQCLHNSDCKGMETACKERKQFISCGFLKEHKQTIRLCHCRSNPYCDFNNECEGDFTKRSCKKGEIGRCENLNCRCVVHAEIGGGSTCTNDECEELRKTATNFCAKSIASSASVAASCADNANTCYDKCINDHKCIRDRHAGKITFVKQCHIKKKG